MAERWSIGVVRLEKEKGIIAIDFFRLIILIDQFMAGAFLKSVDHFL
jgi:hypothetical protein